jgi:iron complex outermembrane receptor protein
MMLLAPLLHDLNGGRRLLMYGLLIVASTAPLGAQSSAQAADAGLDSLLNTRIDAASKYSQTSAEAPASVTIITGDEIRLHGYRNLGEVLENVRGFYVSNDRNYPSLGTRGFSRPADYNNRILLLIDGHSTNESVWGGAPGGADLPINLRAIERIEVVRGPGSALYGSSAMFGVINIVTKTGVALDGIVVGASGGTGKLRQADVTAGRAIGTRGSLSVSGAMVKSDGRDLYFPEFDTDDSDGFARQMDWEDALSGFATFSWADATARAGFWSRAKGVPTASFDMAFADPRAETYDAYTFAEVAWRRQMRGTSQLSARVNVDRYKYHGSYPQVPDGLYMDKGTSESIGGETMLVLDPASNHRLTLGTEFRHTAKALYWERDIDGSIVQDNAPYNLASAFAQSELQIQQRVSLISGLRVDRKTDRKATVAPRLALVVTPDHASTVKLLYGEAFRAPSASEADLNTSFYIRNPSLRPERIRTFEIEAQRRLYSPVLLTLSLYEYRIRDLIEQIGDDEVTQFRNVASTHASGAELQLDVQGAGAVGAQVTYSVQQAKDVTGDTRMTNSPSQVGRVSLRTTLAPGLRSTTTVRYESGRLTLAGPSTSAFVRTDLNFAYTPRGLGEWARATDFSLRITNLFDEKYQMPAGYEHRQVSLPADARALSVAFHWRY